MNFKVTEFEGKYYYTTDNGKRYGEGYEFARPFSEGYAAVVKNGKWFFVDKNFVLCAESHRVPCDFYQPEEKSLVFQEDGFDWAYDFHEGFAVVVKNNRYYFLGKDFKIYGEGFEEAYDFSNGYARVKKDDKWFFVDKNFNIHGEGYDNIKVMENGKYLVQNGMSVFGLNKNLDIFENGQDYIDIALANPFRIEQFPVEIFSDEFANGLIFFLRRHFEDLVEQLRENGDLEAIKQLQQQIEEVAKNIKNKRKQFNDQKKRKEEGLKKLRDMFHPSKDENKKKNENNGDNNDDENNDDENNDDDEKPE